MQRKAPERLKNGRCARWPPHRSVPGVSGGLCLAGRCLERRHRMVQTGRRVAERSAAMRRTVSCLSEDTGGATRRPGDPATRRPGDPATRRPGDPATRRPGLIILSGHSTVLVNPHRDMTPGPGSQPRTAVVTSVQTLCNRPVMTISHFSVRRVRRTRTSARNPRASPPHLYWNSAPGERPRATPCAPHRAWPPARALAARHGHGGCAPTFRRARRAPPGAGAVHAELGHSAMAHALASARSRAMARVTTGKEPRPRLVFVPLEETACAQVLDRPPDLRGVTSKLGPRPTYPSPPRHTTINVLI